MIQFMSAREAAEKWNISNRRVSILCAENRIPNVAMLGRMWLIPRDAEKPIDARTTRAVTQARGNSHPFVKWAGGKGQILEILRSNLPQGLGKTVCKYVEPFVGGGALLFSLLNEYQFQEVYINDKNQELMNVYATIQNSVNLLIKKLRVLQSEYEALLPLEQQEYFYEKRELFNQTRLCEATSVQKAALFIFLNKTCFNGLYRVNRVGKFNVPAGKYKNPLICDEENLRSVSQKLQRITIISGDYSALKNVIDENTFVYFDPPYRPLNATSSFTSYTQFDFNDEDQKALARFYTEVAQKGAKAMLSNSDPHNLNEEDNFFDELYSPFRIQRIEASRMINSNAAKRGKIKELLITNY